MTQTIIFQYLFFIIHHFHLDFVFVFVFFIFSRYFPYHIFFLGELFLIFHETFLFPIPKYVIIHIIKIFTLLTI